MQAAIAAFLNAILPGIPGSAPAVFVGSIIGTTLTVSPLSGVSPVGIQGIIALNVPLLGLGVAPGTIITDFGTGSGGVGTYTVSISQNVPSATMATGVTVVAGQQNRVVEPANPFFVVFTPLRFTRLATNVDTSEDVKLTGAVAGNTLSVTDIAFGIITPRTILFGIGVALPTTIIRQISGLAGGTGTYLVAPSQTVPSGTLSAGQKTLLQSAQVDVQLDFHSPDTTAGDWAQTISTALRDEFGVSFFAALPSPLNGVVPFYADDPHEVPFINAENAYEWRWSLDAAFEVDQVISVPTQYSDSADVTLVEANPTT